VRLHHCLSGFLLLASLTFPAFAQPAPRAAADRVVTILNHSHRPITQIFVSNASSDDWGENRMTGPPLLPGHWHAVRLPRQSECSVDIQVVYDDASTEEDRAVDSCRGRQFTFDGSGATPSGEAHQLALSNAGQRAIREVYISPPAANGWGSDALGDDTIAPGAKASVTFHGACEADLRVVFDNDAAEERRKLDLCRHAALTIAPGWTTAESVDAPPHEAGQPAQPQAGSVRFRNRSGHAISSLYVYREGESEGEDRLGSDTLADGQAKPIDIDRGGGCRYHVKIVYEDSTPDQERAGVDLCQAAEVTITGGEAVLAAGPVGRIRNGGAAPIVALFADPPGAPRGPDRLGEKIIGVGEVTDLAPPQRGQCRYGLTAVFRNGPEVTQDADLCAGEEITLR